MKKILGVIVLLIAVYFLGPKPAAPVLTPSASWTDIPDSVSQIDAYIAAKESKTVLKPGNEARVIWADSAQPKKTKIVFMYVHGFSASPMEGDPLHREVAKKFGANLLLARVAGHGVPDSDSTYATVTADDYYQSVENYYAIAKKLGDEVVVLGTSFGGAMSLVLAANHPEIKALMLYGPCIAIKDPNATLLDNPWGLQMAHLITGSDYRDIPVMAPGHAENWSLHYRLEGVVAVQNLLTHAMTKEVFEKVKIPVFMGYYYKDEEHQDNVVSVDAMKEMYAALGTPAALKREEAFPNSGNHVITSNLLGKLTDKPIASSEAFLRDVVKLN
ncbi:alpha/beta hydrolase [Aquirufa antheringensis]|jgi:esterase/lipase|uniref:alpha/beta hydrolase n=1 Tax=Aquirufa antheringensis TaxID=2516559 RepID=UPI001F9C4CB8|nr:alpha/beta fold hydrolase [Aquirufa antheringensis]MCE4217295.1 alpha/beta hydrolase [Pseudarcicella sp. GAP-15]MCZ2478532.1 alpha/beta hydrolase [Aquirufa antheringensis]